MSNAFDFQVLRRFPDLEADNLVAVDATDRLVLAAAGAEIRAAASDRVVVVGDRYGAMTLGAMALHGAEDVRVHQDPITGEQALAGNASRGADGRVPSPLRWAANKLPGQRWSWVRCPDTSTPCVRGRAQAGRSPWGTQTSRCSSAAASST